MAIMVGNGANAGALSPFAPTGIIVNGLMARNGLPGLRVADVSLQPARARRASPSAATCSSAACKLFGAGQRHLRRRPSTTTPSGPFERAPLDHDWRHRRADPQRALRRRSTSAWARSSARSSSCCRDAADDGEAIKRMPWRVIVMVCGVTVLIALVERAQGIDLLVSLVARIASAQHRDGRRRVPDRARVGLQQHVGRRAAGVSPDGAGPGRRSCPARARSASRRR